MNALKSERGGGWIWPLALLLFAALLTARIAFAAQPGGDHSNPAESNVVTQGSPTPTATITCTAGGTPGPWAVRANYPQQMVGLAVASDGTYIYGFAGRNSGRQNEAYKYNYTTDSWTALTSYPYGAGIGPQAEYGRNGKIYVVGGTTGQSATGIYDIASNSWAKGAPIPAMVIDHGLAYWNGKLYVVGGGQFGVYSSAVYAYDIASNTWSTLAALPQAERGMATDAINGKIYVANGETASGVTNSLYIYDIATDTWSAGPPSPLASGYPASTVVGGKLYMIGGNILASPGYTNDTYLYDPTTNSWSAGPDLNVGRYGSGAAIINTPAGLTTVVVGGAGPGSPWIDSVEASTAPSIPCAGASATVSPTTMSATGTCTAAATPGPWAFRTQYLGDERYALAVASDGTTIYGFGGRSTGRQGDAYKYNYATNTWAPIAYIGDASFNYHAEYGNNGNIYLMGGASNEYLNRIYDIATDSWSHGATPPGPLTSYGSAYWKGKVYTIGGAGSGAGVSNAVYAYDISTDTWSTLAPLPQAEAGVAAGAINGKIYVANGTTGQNVYTNNLYIYDIATNTWSNGPPSPQASAYPADAVIGGKLYMIGGGSPARYDTYLYDPATQSWSQGPSMNDARFYSEAATINTPAGQTAIVVGGWGSGITWLSSVEASTAPRLPCVTATPPTNTPTRTATGTNTPKTSATATPANTSVPPTFTSTIVVPSHTTVPHSSTPVIASQTPVSPTSTAVATPTTCTISFTDVPPDFPFYDYIRCLACRGIVSGYDDGTFRPYNEITRAQISKVVCGASSTCSQIPTPTEQSYEDVAPGSTFYVWIEKLSSISVMGGYPCGSDSNEPCIPPLDRPYFRPFNNATRGQLSKIVSNAAGFQEPPEGQTFEDVPPDNPFYPWIQRLATRGIMGGYPCGSDPNEQCIPPLDRPYFRWGANVTRGQASKIVANTFFPNCQTPGRR
jgi:N-acetylneuraminic acid mutarotase